MLEDHSVTDNSAVSEPDVDFIQPDEADKILDGEIEKLQQEGWVVKRRMVYGARLMRERDVLDLRVDLLGKLEKTQGVALVYGPEIGRLVAWMVLLAWLLAALVFASVIGLI